MPNSNSHVYVVPVVLEPHPDPETTRLSIVRVNAYTCVVATEDWKNVDKALFIPPDTVVPNTPEFAFLKRNNSGRATLDKEKDTLSEVEYNNRLAAIESAEAVNTKNLRITARRIRGVQSFGMLFPIPEGSNLQIGDDAWDLIGFKRYAPPIKYEARGEVVSPPDIPWVHVYDVDNYYNFPDVFQSGEQVVATEKLDGANARFVYARNRESGEYEMFCGSRSEWKRESAGNMWWAAFFANPWLKDFCISHPDWVVYGEVFGNVQKLKYGVKPNQANFVRVFDVLAGNRFLDYEEFETLFTDAQRAPVLYRGVWDAEVLKDLSNGKSTLADHIREGMVIVPLQERHDTSLGRVKLKIVSFDFLAKG